MLLIYAPYGDFTYPYHSLAYLVPPLRSAGYSVRALDLNIEWFRLLFRPHQIESWRSELRQRYEDLQQLPAWTIEHQDEVVRVVRSLAVTECIDPERALDILRGPRFYDYRQYLRAQMCVRNFERLLEYFYPTYPFFTAFSVPPGEPNSGELVSGALASRRFIAEIRGILDAKLDGETPSICGLSAPFSGNLRLGFAALTAVKEKYPGIVTVAGGTAISDLCRYRESDETLGRFAAVCDFFLPGEAESSIVEFAHWVHAKRESPPQMAIDLRRPDTEVRPRKSAYLDIRAHDVPPDFSWVDWSLYLSPVRHVNYSPTRGCFWNRCTFCDYGMNDQLPTAPYRDAATRKILSDLARLKEAGIDQFYFAVDAISPSLLRQIATGLVEQGLTIHWSSEFFLTRHFDAELVRLLERSGLVTASFGFESGSSRVLERMGKGSDRVESVYQPGVEAFRGSRIGLQPKFFFGFPGETAADRKMTAAFLNRHRDVFSIVTQGNLFELTSGAIVAKQPERFGITNIRRKPGSDVNGACDFDPLDDWRPPDASAIAEVNEALSYFHAFERPWVGGIDTLHSKLYMERYGRSIFHRLSDAYAQAQAQAQAQAARATRPWAQTSVISRFDLDRVFEDVLVYNAMKFPCTMEMLTREVGSDALRLETAEMMLPKQPDDEPRRFTIEFC